MKTIRVLYLKIFRFCRWNYLFIWIGVFSYWCSSVTLYSTVLVSTTPTVFKAVVWNLHHSKEDDWACTYIIKTRLFKYIENFTTKKGKFSVKKRTVTDIFHISAQNIDCGYSLELPRRGGSNVPKIYVFWAEIRRIMYTPVNPSFIK